MIYILLVFYTVNGNPQMERIEVPSYQECLAERGKWLKEAKRYWWTEVEAHCVLQVQKPE
jgi:hypothetical protein